MKPPSRDEIAAMSDAELCAYIVASSTLPPATTIGMLRDSRQLNDLVFPDEGHARWRSVTEKIACAHANLPEHWEAQPTPAETVARRNERHAQPMAQPVAQPIAKSLPPVKPRVQILGVRDVATIFGLSATRAHTFIANLKSRGVIRSSGKRGLYIFPSGAIGRARNIIAADSRYGGGGIGSNRHSTSKRKNKKEKS